MNEALFFFHIPLIVAFLLAANRFGKEMLIAFFAISAMLANIFVTKQITMFHANVTCTDAFAVSCILSLNLLQETYGKAAARKAVWIAFFLLLYLAVMSQIHLLYQPNNFDQTQASFQKIFRITPRLFAASAVVAFIVQQIDIQIFGLLKKKFPSLFFFRIGGSFFITQWIDTVLFTFLGLYGIVANLWSIVLISFLIKLAAFALMSPFLSLARRLQKFQGEPQ
ncbi:MAG: queuosine precursor transporter [Simkaniaceae bacterium]